MLRDYYKNNLNLKIIIINLFNLNIIGIKIYNISIMDIRKYFNISIPNQDNQNNQDNSTDNKTETKKVVSEDSQVVKHIVFTDGSTFNNGKKKMKQYGGIGVFFADDDPRNISKILEGDKITNNVAELTACQQAIESIIETPGYNVMDVIIIYTDSEYMINSITKWVNGWIKNEWKTKNKKPVQNKNLILKIYNLYKKHNIFFRHVKAHQPMPNNKYSDKYKIWYGNHMADKFATDASQLSMN